MDDLFVSDVIGARASLRERARTAFTIAQREADEARMAKREALTADVFTWLREECGVTEAEIMDIPDFEWSNYSVSTEQAEFSLDNIKFRARFEKVAGDEKMRMEIKKPSGSSWEKVTTLDEVGKHV